MSRFQDCSVSFLEYGEKEMVLRWVETGKGKKRGEPVAASWDQPEHQPLEPTDLKLCNPQHVLLLGHFGAVVGKVSAMQRCSEWTNMWKAALFWRFCFKYTVQFTKLFVMFSWQRLFDLNHRCGPVMPCFLVCSCRLPFFFSSLAPRVSVTREAQSSYSSARCFTAFIMGNRSSSVYL